MLNKLKEIYSTNDISSYVDRIENAKNSFNETFKSKENLEVFSVSGRIEIGGNHTDHQLGKVLCASINLDTLAVCQKRNDTTVRLFSEGYGETTLDVSDTAYIKEEENKTIGLIRGVCNKFKEKGYNIGGFNAYVTSDVLSGSGMSSSASFEGLLGNILNTYFANEQETQVEIAKTGQYAENVYFGKPSGLMDQIGCVIGGFVYIDFYDKENPVIEKIDASVISNDYDICIIDTGDAHDDLTDEYSFVTEEMGKVSAFFGETHLSRVNECEFYAKIGEIRKVAGDRAIVRAIHFFEDNRHVELQVKALKEKNVNEFLRLVNASGYSSVANLQNIFACKEPHIQGSSIILALCKKFLKGNGACRIHGGGFGGTIEAFVPKNMSTSFKVAIENIIGVGNCHVVQIRNVSATKI